MIATVFRNTSLDLSDSDIFTPKSHEINLLIRVDEVLPSLHHVNRHLAFGAVRLGRSDFEVVEGTTSVLRQVDHVGRETVSGAHARVLEDPLGRCHGVRGEQGAAQEVAR